MILHPDPDLALGQILWFRDLARLLPVPSPVLGPDRGLARNLALDRLRVLVRLHRDRGLALLLADPAGRNRGRALDREIREAAQSLVLETVLRINH